jgi:hypothetical protein
MQAIQDPTGQENAKNIYFGLIMGISAALPTCLHLGLFISSIVQKTRLTLFPSKSVESDSKKEKSIR